MSLGILIIGLIFGAAALNGTISDQPASGSTPAKVGLGSQLNSDLFGTTGSTTSPGLLKWFGALFCLGAIFKILGMPGAGKAFLGLVILAYFAKNPGVITQLTTQIGSLGSAASQVQMSTPGLLNPAPLTTPLAPVASSPGSNPGALSPGYLAGTPGSGTPGLTGGSSPIPGSTPILPSNSFSPTPSGTFSGVLGGFGL